MTTTADFVDLAQHQLRDSAGANWAPKTLLDYLNKGVRALLEKRPELYTVISKVSLVTGAVQTIPADGIAIVDVRFAVDNSDDYVNGVTPFDRRMMNAEDPDWMLGTGGHVRQWAPGENLSKQWYCYPPQPATPLKAEIEYTAEPTELDFEATIPVPSTWDSALLDYVMARALSEDGEYGDLARAGQHMTAFNEVANRETANG